MISGLKSFGGLATLLRTDSMLFEKSGGTVLDQSASKSFTFSAMAAEMGTASVFTFVVSGTERSAGRDTGFEGTRLVAEALLVFTLFDGDPGKAWLRIDI